MKCFLCEVNKSETYGGFCYECSYSFTCRHLTIVEEEKCPKDHIPHKDLSNKLNLFRPNQLPTDLQAVVKAKII